MRKIIILLCLLTGFQPHAQDFNKAKADSLLDILAQYHKAMGSVGIYKNNRVIYERGYGAAFIDSSNGRKNIANTAGTVYRIGSVTKMFTTVMIFQLIEQGKLHLDTKLSRYFPEIPNAADITIEHLLTHHSGLHSFTEDADFDKVQYQTMTEADILNLFRQQQPDFKPGEKGAYSNTNFVLLGYIVEKITGKDYCTALKKNIVDKAHLKHTGCGGKIDITKGQACSYSWSDSSWNLMEESNMSIPGGAGCITSTVGDMAQFIRAIFDHRLVNAQSLAMMKAQVDNYGHGLFQMPFYDHLGYGHNGHIDNFSTSLAFFPSDSVIVSVACNALNYDFNALLMGLLSIYYKIEYQLPDFTKTYVNVSPDVLKSYEGIYTSKAINLSITIRVDDDGQLTAQATNQGAFPLQADSDRSFSFDAAGIVIKFQQIENGHPKVLMLHQGGSAIPFDRQP